MAPHPTLFALSLWALFSVFSCTSSPSPPTHSDPFTDAPGVSVTDSPTDSPSPPCSTNLDCSDGVFCNGLERCLLGHCVAGLDPCTDNYSCTHDTCDERTQRCHRISDDSLCGDSNACNGIERCNPSAPAVVASTGCEPVRADNRLDCNDNNTCTLDACDSIVGCVHSPRDLDGDGHVARTCTVDGTQTGSAGDDCDDNDPVTFPGATERCDDGRDNDCDGRVDQAQRETCSATNNSCLTAQPIALPTHGSVTVVGSSVDFSVTTPLACGGTAPRRVSYYRFTLASPADLVVTTDDTSVGNSFGALSLSTTCERSTVLRCARGALGQPPTAPELRLRALQSGTYFLAVQTSSPRVFHLRITVGEATAPPPHDTCATASARSENLSDGETHTADFSGLTDDLNLSCDTAARGPDAVFSLTLTERRDVALSAVSHGDTTVTLAVSHPTCGEPSSELRCAINTSGRQRIVLRDLAPGGYFVIVRSSSGQSVDLRAELTDPAVRERSETCPGVEAIADGGEITVPFGRLETVADIGTSCGSRAQPDGWTDAVVRFTLDRTRDVSVTVDGSGTSRLSMQLQTACTQGTSDGFTLGPCTTGSPPSRRYPSLQAGTYFLVIESSARPAGATVSIRTSDPGARQLGDFCPGVEVPVDGAPASVDARLFENTSDYGTFCGSRTPTDHWTDWVFNFVLTARRDVTLTMLGGVGLTRFQLESHCGSASTPLGGCVSGGSFLERTFHSLDPGRYFVVGESSGSPSPTGPIRMLVATRAPMALPAGEHCSNAIVVVPDGPAVSVALDALQTVPDVGTSCGSALGTPGTWVDFVTTFTLTRTRDVAVTVRAPSTLYGALRTRCTDSDTLIGTCFSSSSPWSQRYSRLGPGSYTFISELRTVAHGAVATVEVSTVAP